MKEKRAGNMKHDPLCRQRYQSYENDEHCSDCALIAKVREDERSEVEMSNIRYVKCDNCDTKKEIDDIIGCTYNGWFSLWADDFDVDLCSYECLAAYVKNLGGSQ